MDNIELNEMLKDKTVNRVEPGTTPGWVVLFFDNNDPKLVDAEGKPFELFLTIFVGGSKVHDRKQHYYSNCALHCRTAENGGTIEHVRDYSTEMPIAMADTIKLTGVGEPKDS